MLLAFASAPGTPKHVMDRLLGAVWVSLPAMELHHIADSMWALTMMDVMSSELWNLMMIWFLSKQALNATSAGARLTYCPRAAPADTQSLSEVQVLAIEPVCCRGHGSRVRPHAAISCLADAAFGQPARPGLHLPCQPQRLLCQGDVTDVLLVELAADNSSRWQLVESSQHRVITACPQPPQPCCSEHSNLGPNPNMNAKPSRCACFAGMADRVAACCYSRSWQRI